MTKTCKKCGVEKELSEFFKHKIEKDGLCSYCKICAEKMHEIWRKYNSNKIKKYNEKWRKNNIEYRKKYYQNNIKKFEKYRQDNIKKTIEYSKIYYKNNKKRYKKIRKKYQYNRKKTDIRFKLKSNISSAINRELKRRLSDKNSKSTFSFLPYTVDDLIKHLESLFQPWMNWQNYGNKAGMWCIDHRYPDSSFNYKSVEDEEFKKCWALENLQPMEYIENIKKSDKLIYV